MKSVFSAITKTRLIKPKVFSVRVLSSKSTFNGGSPGSLVDERQIQELAKKIKALKSSNSKIKENHGGNEKISNVVSSTRKKSKNSKAKKKKKETNNVQMPDVSKGKSTKNEVSQKAENYSSVFKKTKKPKPKLTQQDSNQKVNVSSSSNKKPKLQKEAIYTQKPKIRKKQLKAIELKLTKVTDSSKKVNHSKVTTKNEANVSSAVQKPSKSKVKLTQEKLDQILANLELKQKQKSVNPIVDENPPKIENFGDLKVKEKQKEGKKIVDKVSSAAEEVNDVKVKTTQKVKPASSTDKKADISKLVTKKKRVAPLKSEKPSISKVKLKQTEIDEIFDNVQSTLENAQKEEVPSTVEKASNPEVKQKLQKVKQIFNKVSPTVQKTNHLKKKIVEKEEVSSTVKKPKSSKIKEKQVKSNHVFDNIPLSVQESINEYFIKKPITGDEETFFDNMLTNKSNVSQDKHLLPVKQEKKSELKYVWRRFKLLEEERVKFKNLKPTREIIKTRKELPMAKKKEEILDCFRKNNISVTVITGATGSGKSTQVPQFILEDAMENNKDVRVVVTQPRRISAVSLADRVSKEIGDVGTGNFVGYSIRLENKSNEHTKISYCTTGTLLRGLSMSPEDNNLTAATHVILDEVHERDSNCDILLTMIRDMLSSKINNSSSSALSNDFHLILMSATVQAEKFKKYFEDLLSDYENKSNIEVNHINCKGSLFPITVHYLDTILPKTKFLEDYKEISVPKPTSSESFDNLLSEIAKEQVKIDRSAFFDLMKENDNIENKDIDGSINEKNEAEDKTTSFNNSFPYSNAEASVDSESNKALELYRESRKSRRLRELGDIDNDLIVKILEYIETNTNNFDEICEHGDTLRFTDSNLTADIEAQKSVDESKGAVLIFLPGWSDITNLMEVLEKHSVFGDRNNFEIYPLHSGLDTNEQRLVFKKPRPGARKIVLSTNIAETSVTIDDVVYVIDTVLKKQLTHDPYRSQSLLDVELTDKASSTQRAGRAGRVRSGVNFRLVSKESFNDLEDEATPELLKMSLEELVLLITSMENSREKSTEAPYQSSNLSDSRIAEFFSRCPDAPKKKTIRNAIEMLKRLQALNSKEQLTTLGSRLSKLPCHPSTGAMLIIADKLGYLDDALTLGAYMSIGRAPFATTIDESIINKQKNARKTFSQGYESDHLVNLCLYDIWMKEQNNDPGRAQFCMENGVSYLFMQQLEKLRKQLENDFCRIQYRAKNEISRDQERSPALIELLASICNSERLAVKVGKNYVVDSTNGKSNKSNWLRNSDEKKSWSYRISLPSKSTLKRVPSRKIHGQKSKSDDVDTVSPVTEMIAFDDFLCQRHDNLLIGCSRVTPVFPILFSRPISFGKMPLKVKDETGNHNMVSMKVAGFVRMDVPVSFAMKLSALRQRVDELKFNSSVVDTREIKNLFKGLFKQLASSSKDEEDEKKTESCQVPEEQIDEVIK